MKSSKQTVWTAVDINVDINDSVLQLQTKLNFSSNV